jgi:hypothetical protein
MVTAVDPRRGGAMISTTAENVSQPTIAASAGAGAWR